MKNLISTLKISLPVVWNPQFLWFCLDCYKETLPLKRFWNFPPTSYKKRTTHGWNIALWAWQVWQHTQAHTFEANLFVYLWACVLPKLYTFEFLLPVQWTDLSKWLSADMVHLYYMFLSSSLLSYIFPYQVAKLGHSTSEQSPEHQKNL